MVLSNKKSMNRFKLFQSEDKINPVKSSKKIQKSNFDSFSNKKHNQKSILTYNTYYGK